MTLPPDVEPFQTSKLQVLFRKMADERSTSIAAIMKAADDYIATAHTILLRSQLAKCDLRPFGAAAHLDSVLGVANEAEIESEYIGRIEIFDKQSTVELPEGMPKEIFKHLKSVWVSGQRLQISRLDGAAKPGATASKKKKPKKMAAAGARAKDRPKPDVSRAAKANVRRRPVK